MDFDLATMDVTMYFNAFLAFWLVLGFLWGLIRGFKKSLLRFVILASVTAVLMFFMPKILISSITMEINGQSLEMFLNDALKGFTQTLNISLESLPNAYEVIKTFAALLASSIVFIVVFLLAKIITWPIYAILSAIFIKKYTITSDGKREKKKKFRLMGALVGLVQGALIAMVFFIPIAGVVDIGSKVLDVVGEDETSIFSDYLKQEYLDYYEESIAGELYGTLGIDLGAFKLLTTTKMSNGSTMSLSDEAGVMIQLVSALGDSIDFSNLDPNKIIEQLSAEDSEFFANLSEPLFSSTIVRNFIVDAINYYGDSIALEGQSITHLNINLDWNQVTDEFNQVMSDLMTYVLKPLIVDRGGEDLDINAINFTKFGEILDYFKNTTLVKNIFNRAMNANIALFNDVLKEAGLEITGEIDFVSNPTYFTDLFKAVNEITGLMDSIGSLDITNISDLTGVLESLNNLDPSIKGIINDKIGEMIFDTLGNDELKQKYSDLDFLEAADIFVPILNLVEVANTIGNQEAPKLDSESIAEIVDSLESIGSADPQLEDFLRDVVDGFLPEDISLPEGSVTQTIKEEAGMIEILLTLNNMENEADEAVYTASDAEMIVAALDSSKIITDMLIDNNATLDIGEDNELKAALEQEIDALTENENRDATELLAFQNALKNLFGINASN